MPLKKSAKKSAVGENIAEFRGGPTFAATKAKFGEERAAAQAVAVAMETQRRAKRGAKKRPS